MLMGVSGTVTLVVLLALLIGSAWRSAERLAPLDESLAQLERLEERFRLLMGQIYRSTGPAQSAPALVEGGRLIGSLAEQAGALSPDPAQRLRDLALLLESGDPLSFDADDRYPRALQLLGEAFREELAAQRGMVAELRRHREWELQAALTVSLSLPLLALAGWLLFRRRVLQPLDDLGSAIRLMARKEFRHIDCASVDPAIRPVFDQYNRMAARMQDLEAGHVKREASLRRDLEQAAGVLLKQWSVLARADRMAAVGSVVARLAHRLRSPLSGVVVTLSNLREETESPSLRERLSKSIEALRRSFDELSALAEEVRQDPEPRTPLVLRGLVDELFLLAGYQVESRDLTLENEVPPDLIAKLPEAGTRHALMSLLMHAIEVQQAVAQKYIGVAAADLGDRVQIAVSDRGPGFSDVELRREIEGRSAWNRPVSGLAWRSSAVSSTILAAAWCWKTWMAAVLGPS